MTIKADSHERFPVLATSISSVTFAQAVGQILGWVAQREQHYVNVCTVHTMLECQDAPALADIVNRAGLAVPDGMPLVWIGRRQGGNIERVYGPDLMLGICQLSVAACPTSATGPSPRLPVAITPPLAPPSPSHFFYGATPEVLAKLVENLQRRFPGLKVAGTYAPPFRPLTPEEEHMVAQQINAAQPDIVWCGLGTPQQDYWVARFRTLLTAPVLIAVGAAFNFHAGTVRQAPRWMMRCGLEWLFRLLMEPRRLWRRYLLGNPRFVSLYLRQCWGEWRSRRKG